MTQANKRVLGNVLLGITAVVLLVMLSGMFGLTPKLAPSRELLPLAMVLGTAGGALRRHGARRPNTNH